MSISKCFVGGAILAAVFGGLGRAEATILIDFEAYGDTANLHGIDLGGVTLASPNRVIEVFDDRFGVSFHSATKAVASPNGCASANPLVGVFDCPVSFVKLWAGDAGIPGEYDSWELLAFDAPVGGNLTASASSGSWVGGPYRQLAVSADNIWRFEANWTGPGCGIGYDDLEFQPIPEPSALILLGVGAVAFLAYASRKLRRA